MLTRLFRKRGTGKGPVVESTPNPFDFDKPLTGQAWIDHENRKSNIALNAVKEDAARDVRIRGEERDKQIARESNGQMRYKTPTELGR